MGKLLHNMDIQLCCFLAGIYVCLHLFGCQNNYINVFSEIQVFKCFLCACAANDAGCEATGGPPQELGAKRLVNYIGMFRAIHCAVNVSTLF